MNYFLVAMGLLWTLHIVYRNNYSNYLVSLQQLDSIISRRNNTHLKAHSGWASHIFSWKKITSTLYAPVPKKTFSPKCTGSLMMSTHAVTTGSNDISSGIARTRITISLAQNQLLILDLPISNKCLHLNGATNSSLTFLSKILAQNMKQSAFSFSSSLKSSWYISFHYVQLTEFTALIIILVKVCYKGEEIKSHRIKQINLNKSTSILILLTLQVILRTSVVESMSTNIPLTTAGQIAQRSSLEIRKLTNIKRKLNFDSIHSPSERTNNKVSDFHYTAQQPKQIGALSIVLVSSTDQQLIHWSHNSVSEVSNNYLLTKTNKTLAVIDPTNTRIYRSSEIGEKGNTLNMYLMSSARKRALSQYQVTKLTYTSDTVFTSLDNQIFSHKSDTSFSSDQKNALESSGLFSSFTPDSDNQDGLQPSVLESSHLFSSFTIDLDDQDGLQPSVLEASHPFSSLTVDLDNQDALQPLVLEPSGLFSSFTVDLDNKDGLQPSVLEPSGLFSSFIVDLDIHDGLQPPVSSHLTRKDIPRESTETYFLSPEEFHFTEIKTNSPNLPETMELLPSFEISPSHVSYFLPTESLPETVTESEISNNLELLKLHDKSSDKHYQNSKMSSNIETSPTGKETVSPTSSMNSTVNKAPKPAAETNTNNMILGSVPEIADEKNSLFAVLQLSANKTSSSTALVPSHMTNKEIYSYSNLKSNSYQAFRPTNQTHIPSNLDISSILTYLKTTDSASADKLLSQITPDSNIPVQTELYRLASQATKVSTVSPSYSISSDKIDNEMRSTLSFSKILIASNENLQTSPYKVKPSMGIFSDRKSIEPTVVEMTLSSISAKEFTNTVSPRDKPYTNHLSQLSSVRFGQISSNLRSFPVSVKSNNLSTSPAFSSLSLKFTYLAFKSNNNNLSTQSLLPYSQKTDIVTSVISPTKSHSASFEFISPLSLIGNTVLSENKIKSSFQPEATISPVKATSFYILDIMASQQATQLDSAINTAQESAQQTSSSYVITTLAVAKSKITPSVHETVSPLKMSPTSIHSISKPRQTSRIQTIHPTLKLSSVLPIKLSKLQYSVESGHSKTYSLLETTLISTPSSALVTSSISLEFHSLSLLKPTGTLVELTSHSLHQTSLTSLESRSFSLKSILAWLEINSSSLTISHAHSTISLSPEPVLASAQSKSSTLHRPIPSSIDSVTSSVLENSLVSTQLISSSLLVPILLSQKLISISIPQMSVGFQTSTESLGSKHESLETTSSSMLQTSNESASSQLTGSSSQEPSLPLLEQTSFSPLKLYREHRESTSFSLFESMMSSPVSTNFSMQELSAESHKSTSSLSSGPSHESSVLQPSTEFLDATGSPVLQPSTEFLDSTRDLSLVPTFQSLQKTSSLSNEPTASLYLTAFSFLDSLLTPTESTNSSLLKTSISSQKSIGQISPASLWLASTSLLDPTLAHLELSSFSLFESNLQTTESTSSSLPDCILSCQRSTSLSIPELSTEPQKPTKSFSSSFTLESLETTDSPQLQLLNKSVYHMPQNPTLDSLKKTNHSILEMFTESLGSRKSLPPDLTLESLTSFSVLKTSTETQDFARSLPLEPTLESLQTTESFESTRPLSLSSTFELLERTGSSRIEMSVSLLESISNLPPQSLLASLSLTNSLPVEPSLASQQLKMSTESAQSKTSWLPEPILKPPETANSSMMEMSTESFHSTRPLSPCTTLETLEATSSSRIKMSVGLLQSTNYMSLQSFLAYSCLTCSSSAGTTHAFQESHLKHTVSIKPLLIEPSFLPAELTSFSILELSTESKQLTGALPVRPTFESADTTGHQVHKLSTEFIESLKYMSPTPKFASLNLTTFPLLESPLGHTESISSSLPTPTLSTQEWLSVLEVPFKSQRSTKSLSLSHTLESLENPSSSMLQESTESLESTKSLSPSPTLKLLDMATNSMPELANKTVKPKSSWSPDSTLESLKTTCFSKLEMSTEILQSTRSLSLNLTLESSETNPSFRTKTSVGYLELANYLSLQTSLTSSQLTYFSPKEPTHALLMSTHFSLPESSWEYTESKSSSSLEASYDSLGKSSLLSQINSGSSDHPPKSLVVESAVVSSDPKSSLSLQTLMVPVHSASYSYLDLTPESVEETHSLRLGQPTDSLASTGFSSVLVSVTGSTTETLELTSSTTLEFTYMSLESASFSSQKPSTETLASASISSPEHTPALSAESTNYLSQEASFDSLETATFPSLSPIFATLGSTNPLPLESSSKSGKSMNSPSSEITHKTLKSMTYLSIKPTFASQVSASFTRLELSTELSTEPLELERFSSLDPTIKLLETMRPSIPETLTELLELTNTPQIQNTFESLVSENSLNLEKTFASVYPKSPSTSELTWTSVYPMNTILASEHGTGFSAIGLTLTSKYLTLISLPEYKESSINLMKQTTIETSFSILGPVLTSVYQKHSLNSDTKQTYSQPTGTTAQETASAFQYQTGSSSTRLSVVLEHQISSYRLNNKVTAEVTSRYNIQQNNAISTHKTEIPSNEIKIKSIHPLKSSTTITKLSSATLWEHTIQESGSSAEQTHQILQHPTKSSKPELKFKSVQPKNSFKQETIHPSAFSASSPTIIATPTSTNQMHSFVLDPAHVPLHPVSSSTIGSSSSFLQLARTSVFGQANVSSSSTKETTISSIQQGNFVTFHSVLKPKYSSPQGRTLTPTSSLTAEIALSSIKPKESPVQVYIFPPEKPTTYSTLKTLTAEHSTYSTQLQPSFIPAHSVPKPLMTSAYSKISAPTEPPIEAVFSNSTSHLTPNTKSIQPTSSSQLLSRLIYVHSTSFYQWTTSQQAIQLKSSVTTEQLRNYLKLNTLSTPVSLTSSLQLNPPPKSVHLKSSSQLKSSWKPLLSSKLFHNTTMQSRHKTPASNMKPSMASNYVINSSILRNSTTPVDFTSSSIITISLLSANKTLASHLKTSLISVHFIKSSEVDSEPLISTRSTQLMPSFKPLHLTSYSASKDSMTYVQSMKSLKLNISSLSILSVHSTQQKLKNTLIQKPSLTPVHVTNAPKPNTSMRSLVSIINISTLNPSNPPVIYLKSTSSSQLSSSLESVQSTNLSQPNTLLTYGLSTNTLKTMHSLTTYQTGSSQPKIISSALVNSTSSLPIHFSQTFEHSTRSSIFQLSLTFQQSRSSLLDIRTKSESMVSHQEPQATNLHSLVFSTSVSTSSIFLDSTMPQLIKTTKEGLLSSLQTTTAEVTSEILHSPSISTSKLPLSVSMTEKSSALHYFKESPLGTTLLTPIMRPSTESETALFLGGQSNLLLPLKTFVPSKLTAYLETTIPEFLPNIIKPTGTEQPTFSTVTEHFKRIQSVRQKTLLSSSFLLTDYLGNTKPGFSSTITKPFRTVISDQPTFLTVIEHPKSTPSYYALNSEPIESVPVSIRNSTPLSTSLEPVSSEKYSTTATLQPSLKHGESIYTLDKTPILTSKMTELPTKQSRKTSDGVPRIRTKAISPTKVQSPTIPPTLPLSPSPTSSATRYPYYGVTNLLSVGIQVKLNIHIKTDSFIENIVQGLEACFVEGMTYLQLNKRAKRRVVTLPALIKRSINVEIKVTNVERLFEDPTKVDVVFYVMRADVPMSSRDSVQVFSQLSAVEASALLRYPVYRPFYILAPPQAAKPSSAEQVFTPLTLALIVVPIAVVSITTVAVIVICCIYRKRNTDKATQFWKKYKSLSLKKPTLEELDLIIDVEKGQIVSRASSCNATPVLKPQQPKQNDNKKQEKVMKPIGTCHLLEDSIQPSFRRAYSDHNFGMRPERLKKLGFHFLDKTRNVCTKQLQPNTLKSPPEFQVLNAKENYLKTDTADIQLMTQTEYNNRSKSVTAELEDERIYETLNNTHQDSKPDRNTVTSRVDQIFKESGTNKSFNNLRTEPLTSQTIIKPSEIKMYFTNPPQIVETNSKLIQRKERLPGDGKNKIGKPNEKVSYGNINSAMHKSRSKLLMTQNQCFESNTISKPGTYNSITGATMSLGDYFTNSDEISLSVDSATDTVSFTDYENDETTMTLAAGGELLTKSSTDSTPCISPRNYSYMLGQTIQDDSNIHKPIMDYQQRQSKHKTRHINLPEYGIVIDRENNQDNLQPASRICQYGSPTELPYGSFNNELYKYHGNLNNVTSGNDNIRDQIHSTDPPNHLTTSLQVSNCSSFGVAIPLHSTEHSHFPRSGPVVEERQIAPNPEMGTHSYKQVGSGSSSQNKTEEPVYDELSSGVADVDPAKLRDLGQSHGIYHMHRADSVVDDGSEFAGDEFETVTFSSDQAESCEYYYKPLYTDLDQRTTMGEMMNPGVNPGMFEHVTKMGRIGGSSQSKPRTRAHFRQIPYQGPVPVHSPDVPPSNTTSPRTRTVSLPITQVEKEKQEEQEDIINISHSTSIASTPVAIVPAPGPVPDPAPQPVPRQPIHYEEMRLGRNMRAAPRGFSAQMPDSAPDSDVSEPLLNLATNQPSNIVVDYLANTNPASVHQSSVTTSAVVSARTITSPQHPSQHLIEMLNRNQHCSSHLRDLEQEQERESEQTRYQQQREQEEQQKQEAIAAQRRQEVLDAQRRHEQDILKQQQLLDDAFPLTNGAGGENEYVQQRTPRPTPRQTAGMSSLGQTKESSEFASTRPFSPKASGSYDYTGGASSSSVHSTLTSGTRGQAVSMEKQELLRQETSDDVNDIEEDIIDDVEAGNDDSDDDALNF